MNFQCNMTMGIFHWSKNLNNKNNTINMEKDLVISTTTDKIEKELIRIEKELKPSAYTPKTNCRFSYQDRISTGESINIRIINDISELIKIFAFINRKSEDYVNATKIIASSIPDFKIVPFAWNGFSVSDWQDDLMYFMRKILYTQRVKELTEYKKTLEPLYSQDKKDQMVIESILSKINF